MAASSDKLDDLNAIDEEWSEAGRSRKDVTRPDAAQLPTVNRSEPDAEIEAMIAKLDTLGEDLGADPGSAAPAPEAAEPRGSSPPSTPPTGTPKPSSRSLMPPYEPPDAKRGGLVPERPMRPVSKPSIPAQARTLIAFGMPAGPPVPAGAKTPPAFQAPAPTPTSARETVQTPVVTIRDAHTGDVTPALTLDLAEMDSPIRKPSIPRVPIDLSDFDASFEASFDTGVAPGEAPLVEKPERSTAIPTPRQMATPMQAPATPQPAERRPPPATAEPRRSSPTPDVIASPLGPEEAIGFELELDLPSAPGVAREFALDTTGDLDALGAVERAAEPESVVSRMEREMSERFDAGDFTAALEAAEWLLRDVPQHPHARRYATSCREVLLQMYAARLGSLDRVPSIVVGHSELRNLGLDHRAGFVLSCVDGQTSFAEILDLSGMPPLESYRILCDLILAHVIAVR